MDDETATETGQAEGTGTSTDTTTTVSDETAAASVAEETTRLREANARLQGENAALRSRPAPAAGDTPARRLEDLSIAELEQAALDVEREIDEGKITPGRGVHALGRIEASRLDRERREQDARDRPLRTSRDRLGEYIAKYPDLNRPGSDLLGKVVLELPAVLDEFGFKAEDPRAQVIAVERVVGGHRMGGAGVDDRERMRRRVPVGGGASSGGGGADTGGGGKKPDPVKEVEAMYPDQMTHWAKMGYSAEEMKAEAPIVLQRRGARRRTV